MKNKEIAKIMKNAKLKALEIFSGESLITAADVISHFQEELLTEYLKNHTIQEGEKFIQSMDIE